MFVEMKVCTEVMYEELLAYMRENDESASLIVKGDGRYFSSGTEITQELLAKDRMHAFDTSFCVDLFQCWAAGQLIRKTGVDMPYMTLSEVDGKTCVLKGTHSFISDVIIKGGWEKLTENKRDACAPRKRSKGAIMNELRVHYNNVSAHYAVYDDEGVRIALGNIPDGGTLRVGNEKVTRQGGGIVHTIAGAHENQLKHYMMLVAGIHESVEVSIDDSEIV